MILAASGCTAHKSVGPQYTLISEVEQGKIIDSLLSRRDATPTSFRALYRAVVYEDKTKSVLRYAIIIKKPNNLRLDVLPVGGVYTLGLFATSNGEAVALDPGNKRAMKSRDTNRAIRTILGLPLSAQELAAVALGTFPAMLSAPELEVVNGDGEVVVQTQDGLTNWQVDSANLNLNSIEIRRRINQDPIALVHFQSYLRDGNLTLPQTMVLAIPSRDLRLELTLVTHDINPDVSDDKFKIAIPDDYSIWEGLSNED